jgi:NTP pyrophosphatase (non-canonical NTP hydrolase)
MRDNSPEHPFDQFLWVVAKLRGHPGCEWDKQQTPESVLSILLQEVDELREAIAARDPADVEEELGDVLFNLLLVGQITGELYNVGAVEAVHAAMQKVILRHPHVFASAQLPLFDEARLHQQEEERRFRRLKRGEKTYRRIRDNCVCPNVSCSAFARLGFDNLAPVRFPTVAMGLRCRSCSSTFPLGSGLLFPGSRTSARKILASLSHLAKSNSFGETAGQYRTTSSTLHQWLRQALARWGIVGATLTATCGLADHELDSLIALASKARISIRDQSMG